MGNLTHNGARPQVFEHIYPGGKFATYDVVEPKWEEPKIYDMMTVRTPSFQEASAIVYSVSIEPSDEGGGVNGNEGEYVFGRTVSLTATPEPGYVFSHWVGIEDSQKFRSVYDSPADLNLYLKAKFISASSWESPMVNIMIDIGKIVFTSTTKEGLAYEIQSSPDLWNWESMDGPFEGTGEILKWEGIHGDDNPVKFYRFWIHPTVPE